MRLQLAPLAALGLVAAAGATGPLGVAHADGTVSARGVYYKERATRVMQPMLDAMFEVGARGLLNAHLLVDAITSASQAAGALTEPFTETRYEAGGGYTHQVGDVRVGASARYSTEPDYQSLYVGLRAEAELAQKNTVLGLGGGVGRDEVSGGTGGGLGQVMLVCTPGGMEQAACDLSTYNLFASASQILGRRTVLGLSYDLAALRGYQSNPYRTAVVGFDILRERHPMDRLRQAVGVSLRYHVETTDTTLIAGYRFYRDNWEINAHTPELRLVQLIDDAIDATFRYRYHWQDEAFFYEERYAMEQAYLTDDVKLSRFDSHTLEGKLGVRGGTFGLDGRWSDARFEGILQYAVQHNRFGNALIAHFALTVPFEY